MEEVEEYRLINQVEELTPKPNSKGSKKGSRSRYKEPNSPGTHSSISTGKKLSKNKIKQRARREAGKNATETMVKEIAAKSREDYLIESEEARKDYPSETPIGTLDYLTATGWEEDSDFKDAIEEDDDSDSDNEVGEVAWRRSPWDAKQVDDRRSDVLRRTQMAPDPTTRGGGSGGGEG